jgi:hypothetical protein
VLEPYNIPVGELHPANIRDNIYESGKNASSTEGEYEHASPTSIFSNEEGSNRVKPVRL